jgi:ABC-type branched-subunit amino acid transport system ATPase component
VSETAVRVRGLRKRYGDVDAVNGVDLDIPRGEAFALPGPRELGGRATATARVSWTGPEGPQAIETDSPTQVVAELGEKFDGEVPA